ncbi:MAG: cellulase family glycosylhydrolase [Oscillospiraceae bacterium]|jgi:endoglucanase|nr:cellulase family glycosylhydrolase [Oscillospiraceae bacterium]
MKRKIISLALTLAMLLAFVPAAVSASAAAFTPVTGWDMMEKLGIGINIGNTLEARASDHVSGLDTEMAWGEARIERWHFQAIAQKGFGNVRIPVTWSDHMDGNYAIHKEWMDRVQEVVDWALAEGLYVTINTHHEHDGLYRFMGKNEDHAGAKKWLEVVWGQIAERFKDYPETLIFEPMNEPLPGEEGWYWDYINYPEQAAGMKKLIAFTNKLNADALEIIRKSGGNNDKRVVALTMPQADANLIDQYIHPDDPYAMLGVFIYPNGSADINAVKKATDQSIAKIKAALDKGTPVVIKETSALGDSYTDAQRLEWNVHVYTELAKLGVPIQYWNCGSATDLDSTLLFDRVTGNWLQKPTVDALFAAYGKTQGPDLTPPPPALPYELEGPYEDAAFTFWTPSKRELATAEKMVVEYEGRLNSGYAFTRFTSDWAQFDNGDKRITEEPGKLTFDIRGLEGNKLGFAAWGGGDAAKITRVYLDTWEGTGERPPEPEPSAEVPNLATADGWAREHIKEAYDKGFLPATLQNNYKADITRGEFVTLAMSWLRTQTGLTDEQLVEQYAPFPDRTFTDTSDTVILAAGKLDITAGGLDGSFRVNDTFTRQQAAVMLSKVLGILGEDAADAPEFGFADLDTADVWARNAINFVGNNDVMTGKLGGRFAPHDTFQRQESIIVFNKMG